MTRSNRKDVGRVSPESNLSLFVALLMAMTWPGFADAAEMPKDKYHTDVLCEARGQTGLPIPGHTADKTQVLAEMYSKRVQLSGRAVGKTPAQIATEIAYWRREMLQEARTGKSNGKGDSPNIGQIGEDCAALPIFEMMHRLPPKGS